MYLYKMYIYGFMVDCLFYRTVYLIVVQVQHFIQDGDTHRIENFFIMRQSRFYNRFSICCLLELSAKPLKGVKKSCF